MIDGSESAAGRRLFVSMGIGRYQNLSEEYQLPGAIADSKRMTSLFSALGYEIALAGLGQYATAEHVRTTISNWSKDVRLSASDTLVFYFAGHGIVEERDRHYLMCWSSDEQDPATTALATEDLLRILTRTGLRNLLVVLDSCYAAQGGADGAQLVLRTLARRGGHDGTSGVWLLSSARAKDEAAEGVFAEAFAGALDDVRDRTGQRQLYLDVAEIVEAINHRLTIRAVRQRSELAAGMVTGLPPFFDNTGYHANLPTGDTDLELQRLLVKRDLLEHFGPRSRGVEFDSEPGLYFNGRNLIVERLVEWLQGSQDDGRGRVVTGSPGCGKSAVLGRIVSMSDPSYRRQLLSQPGGTSPEIPEMLVDVAVHARHKLLPDVVSQIAATLRIQVDTPGQLLRSLSTRSKTSKPIVVVVDALDEAGSGTAADAGGRGEPRRIARELLRPLSEIPNVRLLIGTRRELIASLGNSMVVHDLDSNEFLGPDDIAGYVTKVLLAENEPEVSTPYRSMPDLAVEVGEAVARRAAGIFLVARMTARGLRVSNAAVDTSVEGWQDDLPSEIGEAFEDYLTWFGEDEDKVRSLLMPLAFAEGQGLPRGGIWKGIASALGNSDYGNDDIDWLLNKAAAYIAEVVDEGRSVYRLYHQALAEHLRMKYKPNVRHAQSGVLAALLETVPVLDRAGNLDWFSAHPYIQAHLATHAAAAGRLDEVVEAAGFLLTADQLALLRAFPAVQSDMGMRIRSAYEQAAHLLTSNVSVGERAAYLQLSARRSGADEIAERINLLKLTVPWRVRWARWSPIGAHRQLVGHEKGIQSSAIGNMDGRSVVLTGGDDGTALLWDLVTQRTIGEPIRHGSRPITALAMQDVGDYTLAVTGGDDSVIRVWDLSSGAEVGQPLLGHTNSIKSLGLITLRERPPLVISASGDGTVRLWDLGTRLAIGKPFDRHRSPVQALATLVIDGRIIVFSGGGDNRVLLWDADSHAEFGKPLIGHRKPITGIAISRASGKSIVVTGSEDGTIAIWDVETSRQLGEPISAHQSRVDAIAAGTLDAKAIAVSCTYSFARIWDLESGKPVGQPLGGHTGRINCVAIGAIDHRPVAITAGADRTARIWDLSVNQPLTGHTDAVEAIVIGRLGGRDLAITGSKDATAVLWDLADGKQVAPALAGHAGKVTAVAIGEVGGRAIAATGGYDAEICVWDFDSQVKLRSLSGHTGPIGAIKLCSLSSGSVLVSGSKDGTVRCWDTRSGKQIGDALTGHHADVDMLEVAKLDHRIIVVAGTLRGRVTAWHLDARELIDVPQPDPERWRAVAVGHADGRAVALYAGTDNSIVVWDVVRGERVGSPMVGHTDTVERAVIGVRGSQPIAMTAAGDNSICVWDLRNSCQVGFRLPAHSFRTNALAIGRRGTGVAAITVGNSDMQTRMYSLETFQQLGEPLDGASADTAALAVYKSPKGSMCAAVGEDGTVRLLDMESGELAAPPMSGHEQWIAGVGVAEDDGPVLVSAGALDSAIRIWDLNNFRERASFVHQERQYTIWSTQGHLSLFSRAGRSVAAVISGSKVQLWDVGSRSQIGELSGHTGRVVAIAVLDINGPVLLSGSTDSTARLWDLMSFRQIADPFAGHTSSVSAVALVASNADLHAFTADTDGTVQAWDAHRSIRLNVRLQVMDRGVNALAAGVLLGTDVLVVGGNGGLLRVCARNGGNTMWEAQLSATIQNITIYEERDILVATDMGTLALESCVGGGLRIE